MDLHSIGRSAFLELLPKRIGTNATKVSSLSRLAIGSHDPLRDADGVLGSAPGDVLGGVIVDELLVDGDVLLLGEDGIVHLDFVLVEDVLADLGGDVEEGIPHTDEGAAELCHGRRIVGVAEKAA